MPSPGRHPLVPLVACALMLCAAACVHAATYYVATSGSDTNGGSSPQQAWRTVTHAATKATAGDTVYIKAGLYEQEKVVIRNSGTEGAPIVFQGYTQTPGDTPDPNYKPGDDLNPEVLPVLAGDKPKAETPWAAGSGIVLEGKHHIEIRNIGLTWSSYALYPQNSSHFVIENVYSLNAGSIGFFILQCANATIRNCVVTDAADDNIIMRQTHDSLIEGCRTYGVTTDKAGATDYYIVLQADCYDNVVRDCLAHNTHGERKDIHPGHGIGIKDWARDDGYPHPHSRGNRFEGCVCLNNGEYFFVAHEAYGNEFVGCTAIGQWRTQARWSEGINIRDGAHDNTFRNCRVQGAHTSVALQDTVEGPKSADGSPAVQVCSRNTLTNCVFSDSKLGIEIWNADDNVLGNCVFSGVGQWALVRFPMDRKCTGNVCRNAIVTGTSGVYHEVEKGTGDQVAFAYSDFWQNAFEMPAGTGNIAQDPLYVDAVQGDFHLQSAQGHWDAAVSEWVRDGETSPCIDAGDPADDFALEPEPNGGRINVGAYGGTSEASRGSVDG